MRARPASALTRRSPLSGAIAAATLILAVACAAARSTPTEVSLARLATDEQAYLGETVQALGTVRLFGEGASARHYVMEDDQQHRVALVPVQEVASFVAQRVKVVGRFDFSDTGGRLIRVESIEPSAASAPRGEPSAEHQALRRNILG